MNLSKRFIRVWQRNLKVYRKTWMINFLPPLLEPLFYILAFGLGLGGLIGGIVYYERDIAYVQFITPAIICISIMYNAFFENTYASFVRMYYQKTFDAIMATPLCLDDIIAGEIIWGATRSLIATLVMVTIFSFFHLIVYPWGLFLIPLALLGGIAFGAIGMFFTSIIPHIESFNLPVFLFITPMFLFSETFFPLTNLPRWVQKLSLAFPLTHLVQAGRACCLGIFSTRLIINILYLVSCCLLFFPLSIKRMNKRLIK